MKMYEALLLAVLVVLVILVMRKPVLLDNPLIIQRPGHYHITLAPQLAHAKSFLELIAEKFSEAAPHEGELATQYFEVRATDAPGAAHYLLAVGFRAGILYFQAIYPQPLLKDADSHYETVRRFSEQVMAQWAPLAGNRDASLRAAVEAAAQQLKIACDCLQEAD
ncbi:MAG: hypothetical protein Q7S94_08480 [Gallionella sp.]|nr:hypothetical protein [Gallionella sp.]